MTADITALLDRLAYSAALTDGEWHGWRIQRIRQGANNLLYRATNPQHDLAIKFTIRDARDRAGREYAALCALTAAGLDIAPHPIYIDRERYAQPVVVQTWLDGDVQHVPPATGNEWQKLLEHYALIHTLTPETCSVSLLSTVLDMRSARDGLQRIQQQLELIPVEAQPTALQTLVHHIEAASFPSWPEPPPTLCRSDPNILNFVRCADTWRSVDWEYGGWGDPAFDIADLITHPAYASVGEAQWDWVIETYCALTHAVNAAIRIRTYARLMLVWWAARSARLLYDIPRGQDERLVEHSARRLAEARATYERYLNLATTVLA